MDERLELLFFKKLKEKKMADLSEIRELVPMDDFSAHQRTIIELKARGETYVGISNYMQRTTQCNYFAKHISMCLKRSAMGLHWELGENPSGVPPFLCPQDLKRLSDTIKEACDNGSPMDPFEVLDEACSLKGERLAKGIKFLQMIGCRDLQVAIAQDTVDTPVRSWINKIVDDLDAHIRNRRYIDPKRLESCAIDVIQNFIVCYSNLFQEVIPFLMFGADETMLESTCKLKAVMPNGTTVSIEADFPEMPHISAMLCHNVFGVTLPPFVILSDLKKLPDELKIFTDNKLIWVASTKSGYMTRDAFVLWTFHFVTWLSHFRTSLEPEYRENKVLLIMDGHTSRENPLALLIFRKFNVEVLILPSHTTHVLQMFDRVLAAVLKSEFGPKYRKLLKKSVINEETFNSDLSRARYCAILALLDAWRKASTPSNCITAARVVGMYPYDPNAAASSQFVRDLTEEERERYNRRQERLANRLNISGQVITTVEKIVEIANSIKSNPRFIHLCRLQTIMEGTFKQCVNDFLREPKNDTYLLSPMPQFFSPNRAPINFNQ